MVRLGPYYCQKKAGIILTPQSTDPKIRTHSREAEYEGGHIPIYPITSGGHVRMLSVLFTHNTQR